MRTVSTLLAESPFRPAHDRSMQLLRGSRVPDAPTDLTTRFDPSVCDAAIHTWRARMVNEHRSSAVFAGLLPQLIEASASLDVQTAVLGAATDEIFHATLCGDIVRAFGGDPTESAEPSLTPMPAHSSIVDPLERVLRNVLFVGCLSETVAVALLTVERELAQDPYIRAILETILADEVAHARLGWNFVTLHLPRLDGAARTRLNAYLRVAFAYLQRRELELLPVLPPLGTEIEHQRESVGLCNGSDARGLFFDTIDTVIVPRLTELGLDAREAYVQLTRAQ